MLLKIVTETTKDHCFESGEKDDDKLHIRNIKIKYMIITILKYIKAENVSFVLQSCKNYNKININHFLSQF